RWTVADHAGHAEMGDELVALRQRHDEELAATAHPLNALPWRPLKTSVLRPRRCESFDRDDLAAAQPRLELTAHRLDLRQFGDRLSALRRAPCPRSLLVAPEPRSARDRHR